MDTSLCVSLKVMARHLFGYGYINFPKQSINYQNNGINSWKKQQINQ